MSSINEYIVDAVPQMKARAAKFDNAGRLPMDQWIERDGWDKCMVNLLCRADTNLGRVRVHITNAGHPFLAGMNLNDRENLLDCMNLCALALSLLPEGQDGGEGIDGGH